MAESRMDLQNTNGRHGGVEPRTSQRAEIAGAERHDGHGRQEDDMPRDSMIIDALDALSQELVIVDGRARIVNANAAWRAAHGRREAASDADRGRNVIEVYRSEHGLGPDVVERMRAGLTAVLDRRQRNFRIEYPHAPAGAARPRWFQMTAWPVPNGHDGIIVCQEDVTEQRQLQADLADQAHRDPLTGLPNRRLFRMEGERMLALAERQVWPVTLLYLDLDGFKEINDRSGHEAGDAALRRVASRLQNQMRSSDLLARLGGDEFVILLDAVCEEECEVMIERYRAEIERPMIIHGQPTLLGASIGVAFHPRQATTIDDMLRLADADMYREKEARKRIRLGGLPDARRDAVQVSSV